MMAVYVCAGSLLLIFLYFLLMVKLGKKLRTNRQMREQLGEW